MADQSFIKNQEAIGTAKTKVNARPRKPTKKEREAKKKKEAFFERVRICKEILHERKIRALSQSTLADRQRQRFREILESQKSKLLRGVDSLSKEFRSELCLELDKNRSGNHIAEINYEGSIVTQFRVNKSQERLERIDEAIHRIDNETYGICLGCDEPIDISRLMKTPATRHCPSCKYEESSAEVQTNGICHGAMQKHPYSIPASA
ncbi:MAG: TraR/DksA family transcriptional regulator [bacterium]|nr:TraR/DksA family transcriptional regulator [bacterium]